MLIDFRNDLEREWYEERAAIVEYDAKIPRKQAAAYAYELLRVRRGNRVDWPPVPREFQNELFK